MKKEVNAILAIAARDFTKFLRDRIRIVFTFLFPVIFIGILGGSLQANLGENVGYNFLTFVFVGVIGQTLFQSTASGIISLIQDRENDFSQEMFVSPISRYSIIFGKIFGEPAEANIGFIILNFLILWLGLGYFESLLPFLIFGSLTVLTGYVVTTQKRIWKLDKK